MEPVSGKQLRELQPGSSPTMAIPKSTAGEILENMADLLDSLMEQQASRRELLATTSARRERRGLIAEGLGLPRDADGNVIHVDEDDRPYVYVNNGEIVYVKVYKARITPKGVNLDAKCTIENPDGKREVLLVEPMPTIEAAKDWPL
jgi:hypothetical protein